MHLTVYNRIALISYPLEVYSSLLERGSHDAAVAVIETTQQIRITVKRREFPYHARLSAHAGISYCFAAVVTTILLA
jgi:hypothetical protein